MELQELLGDGRSDAEVGAIKRQVVPAARPKSGADTMGWASVCAQVLTGIGLLTAARQHCARTRAWQTASAAS